MRHLLLIILLCIGICTNADAQSFTKRIQKKVAGQGSVTIHQDSVIDRLVNTAPLGIKVTEQVSKPTPTKTPNQSSASHQSSTSSQSSASDQSSASTQPTPATPNITIVTPDTIDTSKKLMRGYKVSGYRVQAFAGGNSRVDRQKAEQIGSDIKTHYADVPVYVHFYSPRWICRVGNYRTYEEAHQMLVSLRKLGYTQATIVKGKITVQY